MRMWNNQNSHVLGMQNAITVENYLIVSYKAEYTLTIYPIPTYLPKRNKYLYLQKKWTLYEHFICNSPKLETIQMFFNR